jgi:adhesin/invasin
MHRKWLCIPTALVCLLAQQAAARNIFVTPGDSAGSGISTFTVDPFSFGATVGPISGAFTVIGSASATKHYAISRSTTDTITVLEGRFPLLTVGSRLSVGGTPVAAVLTANGRHLVVAGSPGVAIIDTETDRVTTLMGNIDVGGDATDVVSGLDGTRAYVISASSSRLTAIDLAGRQSTGTVTLPSSPTAVTMGPNGILYVSAQNAIYEIDATTLAIRAAIQTNGAPGELSFTPNGRFAIAPSATAAGGRGAFLLNVSGRTVTDISGASYALTDVVAVDNNLAYGTTGQGSVYVIAIGSDGTIGATLASFTGAGVPATINEVASTGELPRARFLVLSAAGFLYRVDLQSNEAAEPVLKPSPGNMVVVAPPGQGGAVGHLAYNTTQTAASGTSSQPLVIRVYDQTGLPVAGVPVVFSTSTSGVTLTNANATSNLEGYASTVVNVPASMTSGAITVNASIQQGQRTEAFTVNIGNPNLPGPGGPGTGGPSVPTGLNIISGHGAVVSAQFASLPGVLRVRLTDSSGNPVSNAPITWSLVRGGGNFPGGSNTFTDSNGEATTTFFASAFQPGLPYLLNVISATAPTGQSVELYVLAVPLLQNQLGSGSIDPLWPTENIITLKAGEVRQGAIQVRASVTGTSFPAPFVGLRLVNPTSTDLTQPNIQCRGGIVLTNEQGVASCDVVAGAQQGEFSVVAVLGEIHQRSFLIRVERGDPAQVRIVSGDNQTGLQGATLQPFVIEVRDAAGNPLPNAAVTWDFPFFFPTPQNIQRTTDINGRASASFTLPSDRSGTFNIRAIAGSATASFTTTVNVAAAGIVRVSGADQIAVIGQAFSQPLQVRVTDAQGRGVANAAVTFNVTSGTATVNSPSATTNAEGVASTTVTAGNSAGPVTVTATSGSQTTTFSLTVRLAGPVFTASDFLNAAGFQQGISPGSIAYIRAAGVAPGIRGTITPPSLVGPLPTRLNDVEVLFNNIPAPIYAVSNVNNEESVIVQVPFEAPPGTANVTIRTAGGGTNTVPVTILPVKPGVFTYTDVNGATYAVATRPDGSYISAANPARRGEEIRVYASGLGQTAPATATNRAGLPGQQVAAQVVAGVNNAGVRVRSSELLEGSVGVYVITMEVPADTPTGSNQPLGLAVTGPDGVGVFANAAYIPIV